MTEAVEHSTVLDTGQQHIGQVYAKALLGAAQKAGVAEQVVAELDSLVFDVLERQPQLDATLSSLRVPYEAKVRMLEKAFAGRMSDLLLTTLKVICRHRRFDCLRAIRRAAQVQYNELLRRVEVEVCSAQPLTPELRSAVSMRMKAVLGSEVELVETLDPQLIGGLVVRVGDTVYDASVANWLVRLRKDALEQTAQTIKEALERFEIAE